jgi:hypothetical protein
MTDSEKQGQAKGCNCDPKVEERTTVLDVNFDQAVLDAIGGNSDVPTGPIKTEIKAECPGGLSNVPSKFFVEETSKNFCEEVMKDLNTNVSPAGTAYDIKGSKTPLAQSKLAVVAEAPAVRRHVLQERSPPEKADNYLDYKIFLGYEHQDGECLVPKDNLCKNAWTKLVQSNCK